MLGERRSKAAFSAGFPEAVREETRQDSGHLPEEIMETEASLDGLDGGEETEENLQNDSLSEQTCEGQMHGKEDIWSEEEDIEDPLRLKKREVVLSVPMTCFLHRRMKGVTFSPCCRRYRRIFPKNIVIW